MVAIYVSLIQKGLRTLENVPAQWKDAVAQALEPTDGDAPVDEE